jgi:2-keto-4-pentenoate hydratase
MEEQASLIDALYTGRRDSAQPSGLDDVQFGLQDALGIQLRVLERFTAAGEQLGGWKVGLTSGKARDRMGAGFRPFGYILRSRIVDSGSVLPRADILNCHLEPELCLIVGSALSGENVSAAEAKAAVQAVAPAFEINEIRLGADKGPAALLADGLAQWGIVLGPPAAVRDDLIHTTVEFSQDGRLIETKTPGESMDDPYLSLSRLCRLLHTYGRGLEPGQPVITGSFCHHAITRPGTYRASFSDIGDVSVHFS